MSHKTNRVMHPFFAAAIGTLFSQFTGRNAPMALKTAEMQAVVAAVDLWRDELGTLYVFQDASCMYFGQRSDRPQADEFAVAILPGAGFGEGVTPMPGELEIAVAAARARMPDHLGVVTVDRPPVPFQVPTRRDKCNDPACPHCADQFGDVRHDAMNDKASRRQP